MVSGASRLAMGWGVRPMVVGLTIVSFGTSAPEMAVSLSAGLSGQGDIAIGNVVGSNIGNIGLVLGLAALLRPLSLHLRLIRFEIPFLIGISAFLYALAFMGEIPRWGGWLLFSGLVTYLILLYRWSLSDPPSDELRQQADASKAYLLIVKVIVGIVLLAGGGHLLVEGAVGLARWAGVSELVIGLTIVAVGTSLPEMVTTLLAVWRGQGEMAIGNIIGSNIFNILGVLGLTAAVYPVAVQRALLVRDFPVMIVLTLLLFPLLRSGFVLGPGKGALFLTIYLGYLALLALGGA